MAHQEAHLTNHYGSARDKTLDQARDLAFGFWTEVAPGIAEQLTDENVLDYHRHPTLSMATLGVKEGERYRLKFLGDPDEFFRCNAAQDWFDANGFRRGTD